MSDDNEILAAAAKLPLDERVAHSNWKVRAAAYEAIKAGCNSVFDSEDPVLSEYGMHPFQSSPQPGQQPAVVAAVLFSWACLAVRSCSLGCTVCSR